MQGVRICPSFPQVQPCAFTGRTSDAYHFGNSIESADSRRILKFLKVVSWGGDGAESVQTAAPLLQIEDYDVVASMLAARSSFLCSLDLWRCRNLTDRGLVELINGCRWVFGTSFSCKAEPLWTCLLSSGCWRSWTWVGAPRSRAAPGVSSTSLAAFLACANSSSLLTALYVTQTSRHWLPAATHCSTLTFWVSSKLKERLEAYKPLRLFIILICLTDVGLLMAIILAPPFRYRFMPDVCRHPLGESCLPEEAPPVVSTAPPPGRLLLLTDRHASCPGALGCLPQRVHKEEFHSVTLGSSHIITQCAGESELVAADTAPKRRRVRSDCVTDCRPACFSITGWIFLLQSINKAAVPGDEVLRINLPNTNDDRLVFAGLWFI